MVLKKMRLRYIIFFLIVVCSVICLRIIVQSGNGGIGVMDHALNIAIFGENYLADIGEDQIDIYELDCEKICGYEIEGKRGEIFSSCISDLDRDGTDEILLITGEAGEDHGKVLSILGINGGHGGELGEIVNMGAGVVIEKNTVYIKEVYSNDMGDINPWKVQTCDVDGDGKTEISVAVYKSARFHPVMAKRPFIYNWHGDRISPKWLGSRLSRPFDDYIFGDINSDGEDELLSIEYLEDGKKAVNSYAWKGFGFESIGESEAYEDILSIQMYDSAEEGSQAINACVILGGQEQWVQLEWDMGIGLISNLTIPESHTNTMAE